MCAQCLKNICHPHYSNKLFSNTYFNTKVTINKIFTVQTYNLCYTSQTVTLPVFFSSRTILEPKTSVSGKSGWLTAFFLNHLWTKPSLLGLQKITSLKKKEGVKEGHEQWSQEGDLALCLGPVESSRSGWIWTESNYTCLSLSGPNSEEWNRFWGEVIHLADKETVTEKLNNLPQVTKAS